MNKVTFLKLLNILIYATCDEDLIENWIQYVPDAVYDEDFVEIAEDSELFRDVVNCFIRLSKHFKYGLKLFDEFYDGSICMKGVSCGYNR